MESKNPRPIRYCHYCGGKMELNPPEHFDKPECLMNHQRELGRIRQRKIYKKSREENNE